MTAPLPSFSDDSKRPQALNELIGLIKSGAIQTITTDIFDTVIWRTVPEPTDVFVLLGERLKAAGILNDAIAPRAFQQLRSHAERQSRVALFETRRCYEVRIHEIWEQVPSWVINDHDKDEVIKLELETELDILVPDLDVLDVFTLAQERGIGIHAISDIYYSKEQLEYLLDQPLLKEIKFDNIFTSSDFRTDKGGSLFDRALEIIDCDAGRTAHIGDNEFADISQAVNRGIHSFWVPRRPERLQRLLERESAYRRVRSLSPTSESVAIRHDIDELTGSLVQLRAKVSRQREAAKIPDALAPYWNFGAEVYGPAFAGFAEWVVKRAEEIGAKKVCCLMREGEFLSQLINASAEQSGSSVVATPLYLNRKVSGTAQISTGSEAELKSLLEQRRAPTVREFLTMIGVDPVSIRPLMSYLDARLDNNERWIGVSQQINSDPTIRATAVRHAEKLRDLIISLINQQVDPDEPIVVVDLGWGATIQKRLASVLRHNGVDRPVHGLYMLSSHRAIPTTLEAGVVDGFLSNLGEPDVICQAVIRSPEVLEQVCMPAQGTQVGINDDLTPILEDTLLPSSQLAQADAVRKGVHAYQKQYLHYRTLLGEKIPGLSAHASQLGPQIARSCADPTEEEAILFGSWLHDEGQFSGSQETLASDRWAGTLKHLHPTQLEELGMQDIYWPAGLARLNDPHQADLIAAQAAGIVRSGVASEPLETGEMSVVITEGIGINQGSFAHTTPRRNLHGLSYLRASLRADHIARFHIELGIHPTIVRIDQLELKIHVQDIAEPIIVNLTDPHYNKLMDTLYVDRFSPRLLGSVRDRGYIGFGTDRVTTRSVFRVDVEFAFAAIGWDPVREWSAEPAKPTTRDRVVQRIKNR